MLYLFVEGWTAFELEYILIKSIGENLMNLDSLQIDENLDKFLFELKHNAVICIAHLSMLMQCKFITQH